MNEHAGQCGKGRQTGVEVEGLSQIKTQCTDQPGIHMCSAVSEKWENIK